MMELNRHIGPFTLLLASVGGFCDTATFVRGNKTFSAHITGNFIIFANEAILDHDHSAWTRLISFPVFVCAALFAGWLAYRAGRPYLLLTVEGSILMLAGLLAGIGKNQMTYTVVMMTVFAMGFQNTFGRLFPKEIFGLTTVMTGNVTQAAIDFGNLLRGKTPRLPTIDNLVKDLVIIGGFLGGCFLGSWATMKSGLISLYMPGAVVLGCAVYSKKIHKKYCKKVC